MANLTHDMQRVVLEQKLGFAATVCPDGTPNLSPKGTTTVWDDEHLLFADIWSPQTVRNLDGNPSIEINVVDPIVRKGYRFKGRATLHSDGDIFERGLALLRERGYDAGRERVKTIVLVTVEHAAPLTSPAYEGGAGEEQIAAKWEEHSAELARRRRARSSGDRDTVQTQRPGPL
jgi:predicted pyridoxine 5'-phosphate oxidase superfamily flavin-nucleotide-binding protein